MAKLYWCDGKIADTPFYLNAFDLNIYSLEELCYLIRKKTGLVDRTLMDEKLLYYMENMLGKPVASLRQMIQMNEPLARFCEAILSLSKFPVSADEWDEIQRMLQENEHLTPFARLVRQADSMFEDGRYFKAFHAYAQNIAAAGTNTQRAYLYGQMAKAAFFLFHYEVAEEFFMRSYKEFEEEDMLMGYLLCKRMEMSKQQYIQFATLNQAYYEKTLEVEKLYEASLEKANMQQDVVLKMPERKQLIREFREMME